MNNTGPFNVTKKNPTHVVIEIFGGDNNLSTYVKKDMQEMLAGMSDNMSALCLADYNDAPAQIVELTKGKGKEVLEKWGEINTGDPEILAVFLSRALATYSRDTKIAIGLWDHGSAVFDETDPQKRKAIFRALKESRESRIGLLKPYRNLSIDNLTTQEKAMLHDVTNGGLLTNREAGRMLNSAFERAGSIDGKVNMIFSDTCLNGMLEVMHELGKYADVIVASEDLEPGDGWNYKLWFEKMAAAPPNDSANWAKQAVEAFGKTYENENDLHPCTLGAFMTDNTLAQAFKQLIETVDIYGRTSWHWMIDARGMTQSFDVYASYDLLHFAHNLKEIAEEDAVKEKAERLANALLNCRVHSVALGNEVPDSHGLAFWFPQDRRRYQKDVETYKTLSFDTYTGWTKYLKKYYRIP